MDSEQNTTSHYCVIYTRVLKQWETTEVIRRVLPEGKGEVFYPCREMRRKGTDRLVYRPMFPGYVFLRSGMGMAELHDYVMRSRSQVLSFVKELKLKETMITGTQPQIEAPIIDLTDEEAAFFDLLFGFSFDAELNLRVEKAISEGKGYVPQKIYDKAGSVITEANELSNFTEREKEYLSHSILRRKRVAEYGVVQMSYGYLEGKKTIIMDGPLRGHEDWIRKVDTRENVAYLKASMQGKPAKAGLQILGKRVWYPKDAKAPDILSDGTAIDCEELARAMSGASIRKEETKRRRNKRNRSR